MEEKVIVGIIQKKWLKHVFENILDTKPSQYETLLPAYMKNNPLF